MKLPPLFKRKKLRATAARSSVRASAQADYEEMSEPNMKLSRALLIVLVLHVVAVSGIIAFNAIKTRQGSIAPAPKADSAVATVDSKVKPVAASSRSADVQKDSAPIKPTRNGSKAKPIEKEKSADSGKVYIVGKGDNPVTIAKKFKVSYDDLIALNHIEDPRKLQIGQKLFIPNKPPKAKKPDE
jgi:LysM repeat protein